MSLRHVFRYIKLFSPLVGFLFSLSAFASDVPSTITYQGRILNPDSTPLEAASVSFNVKILDPSGTCTLFEENFTGIDMTGSNGVFALNLGTGTRADGQAHSFKDSFSNLITFPSTGACGAGYNPTSADSRKLRLVFNDGTPKTVSPDADLQSVPFAMMADRVGGKQVSELLQVNTSGVNDLSQANLESAFTATNYPKLMALIGGTSSDYFRSSQPINMSSQQTLGLGQFTTAEETTLTGGLGAGDAGKTWYNSTTNKMMYWDGSAAQEVGAGGGGAVSSVFGRTGVVTATAGDYTAALVTNSAAGDIASTNVQAAINELDTEKLSLAGGTMTGALDMGANKVTSSATPSTANDLTNKNYVDSAISTAGGSFVAKAGDTMSGALAMGTNKITGVGNPTANQDAATKIYVDNNLRGSSLPAPSAGQDGQAVRWNNGTGAWVYYTPVSAGADNLGNHTATTNLQMSGNSVIGNTTSGGDLTLESTSNATKGDVIINPNGGNVGIGTTSPGVRLQVKQSANDASDGIAVEAAAPGGIFQMYHNGAGVGILRVGSVDGLAISNGGNVGIGTATPNSNTKLDVSGAVKVAGTFEEAVADTNTGASYSIPDTTKNVRRLTLNSNTAVTLPDIGNIPADTVYTLTMKIKQDGTGSRTLDWAADTGESIKWDGGTEAEPASSAGEESIYQFTVIGGETVWYASIVWRED